LDRLDFRVGRVGGLDYEVRVRGPPLQESKKGKVREIKRATIMGEKEEKGIKRGKNGK